MVPRNSQTRAGGVVNHYLSTGRSSGSRRNEISQFLKKLEGNDAQQHQSQLTTRFVL